MWTRLRATGLLLAVVLATACGGPQSTLDPAGPAAETIAFTWWLMLGGAVFVWTLVIGLFLWTLFRSPTRKPLAHPRRLIILGGLVLPTLLLGALLVYGSITQGRVTGIGEPVEHVVEVTGRQFEWQFRHLAADGETVIATSVDELTIPVGQMIEFRVESADVIHGFWIPRLGGKIDAIPGRTNYLRLKADSTGPLRGQCAEFCGLEHAHMIFDVHVVEAGEFAAWLQEQSTGHAAGGPP